MYSWRMRLDFLHSILEYMLVRIDNGRRFYSLILICE